MMQVPIPCGDQTQISRMKFLAVRLMPVIAIVSFLACTHCGLSSTSIGDIVKNPRDYAGKKVTVSGEVVKSSSLVVIKYFTLRDGTGEITVFTHKPIPREGQKITVTGVVKEAFSIGDKTALVITEEPEKQESEKTGT